MTECQTFPHLKNNKTNRKVTAVVGRGGFHTKLFNLISLLLLLFCYFMLLLLIRKFSESLWREASGQRGNIAPSKVPLKPQRPAKLSQNEGGAGAGAGEGGGRNISAFFQTWSFQLIKSSLPNFFERSFPGVCWAQAGSRRAAPRALQSHSRPDLPAHHLHHSSGEGSSQVPRWCGERTYSGGKHTLINHSYLSLSVLSAEGSLVPPDWCAWYGGHSVTP